MYYTWDLSRTRVEAGKLPMCAYAEGLLALALLDDQYAGLPPCVAVCCSVLQCVALCCSMLLDDQYAGLPFLCCSVL